MSVTSYLERRASSTVLSAVERASIAKSAATIQSRIGQHFTRVKNQLQFGSSTRGTILPRSMDEHSDIDYMVIFNDPGRNPQAYLDRLKRFAEAYYGRSEIYQSSPTIVLDLNHIKFELVPATESFWGGYQIPDGRGGWQSTNPNEFNQVLTQRNQACGNLIKPTIRWAKYWNARSGYVFPSYLFEKWIVDLGYFFVRQNQRDYLFKVFDELTSWGEPTQWRREKIDRAKELVSKVRKLERDGYPTQAEAEIQKLIP
jgi:hypothetical protein